jgi:membrane protein
MAFRAKDLWNVVKTAGSEWVNDKAPRLGAALSYYTIFAIPPLFVIALFIASLVFDPNTVRTEVFAEVGGLVGEQSAESIQSAMARYDDSRGLVASVIAVVTLLVTSTGLFIELQSALNTIWGVEEKAGQGIKGFLKNRVLSFAMVIGIGFLLLVSLLISAGLSALSKYVGTLVPGLDVLWMITHMAVAFAVITLLFAMVFKALPDVKIAWRDVWVGAAVTALLFTGGKFLLGLYLGRSSVVSAYGAAGSIVLILLWVYYSAQILFFGAEITQVYANQYGAHLQPKANAQWMSNAERKKARGKVQREKNRKARLLSELKEEVRVLRGLVAQ